MALHNFKLTLLVATLSAAPGAARAVDLPSAGSLGNQLQQDSVKSLDRSQTEGADLLKTTAVATDVVTTTATTIRVKKIVFESVQGVPISEVEAAATPWLNRDVTLADLRRMTVAIEQLYGQRGFLAVRALIPQQSMQDGVLSVRVVEGRYAPPQVKAGNSREQAALQHFVESATCKAPCSDASYVMSSQVDRALYLINDLPGVSAAGTLKAGELAGTTLLDIQAAPIKRVSGYVGGNNHGNTHTGRNQLYTGVALNSALKVGDQFTLDGVTTIEALERHTGLQQYALGYSLPVGFNGTRVGGSYMHLNYVLNGAFEPLDAKGDSDIYSAWVSHPIWLSHGGRLEVRGGYEYSKFNDRLLKLLDRDRDTQSTTAELSGYCFWDDSVAGFSFKSTLGLLRYDDATDKSIDHQTRKSQGQFFKQRIDGYWQQALAPQWSAFVLLRTQLSDSNLDGSQSLLLGGPGGVRAFNADSTSVNLGAQGALELRHNSQLWSQNLTMAGFYDRAEGRINRNSWASNPESDARLRLEGAGAYINFNVAQKYNARLTYARALFDNLASSQSANRVWFDVSMAF
ncbi:ShlB/FhaC/HecB family hemolysin secretion/activation protein [Pseudomonas sp. D47]|uniref:ShlB/FhaC/HecB family hemolysin secretion/activation protein n=1 Tax=Pseudomonas sp. D47 TaxID=3159447 RepID=UPI00387B611A